MVIKLMNQLYNENYVNEDIQVKIGECINIVTKFEKVFGLGGRYNCINQKGKTVENVVEEVFCNQGDRTYFPLPFFLLDNGYGFFVDSKNTLTFEFEEPIIIKGFDLERDKLYVFNGSYKECIRDFIKLTGEAMQAPKWVFGPWISAHRWNSQKMVDEVCKKIRKFDIPISALVLEQWSDEATFYIFNGATYPDKPVLKYEDFSFENSPWYNPKSMIEDLHKMEIKLILWQCPVVKHIPKDESYNERHTKEWEFVKNEKLVVWGEEEPYTIPDGHWFNGSMIPDFTNPKSREWWFNNRQYLIDIGVDGFKTDGGEFIYSEVSNYIGETKEQLKNNYALEYVKAYSEFLGDDKVAFSRAGYTSQQKYTLQWAGDQKSTFSELKAIYNAGISASLCGQINWGFDIGGFSGELPSRDLYLRANQLAVFSPIMQIHSEPVGGQFSAIDPIKKFNNERTPWNMAGDDLEFLSDIRKYYYLRMNLMPYIYSEYLKALEEKSTLMKHMNIDFTGDYPPEQYVFGKLIVAPVLSDEKIMEEKEIEVILPQGDFYNIFTKEKVNGKTTLTEISNYDMHVYIGAGSALVTKYKDLIPQKIDNKLETEQLYFRLYGLVGEYRYIDERDDFLICWNGTKVSIVGDPWAEIIWEIIE